MWETGRLLNEVDSTCDSWHAMVKKAEKSAKFRG